MNSKVSNSAWLQARHKRKEFIRVEFCRSITAISLAMIRTAIRAGRQRLPRSDVRESVMLFDSARCGHRGDVGAAFFRV
jgi:hypothetical protein